MGGGIYLKNAWSVAGWDNHLDDGLLARTICEEPIVFFRGESGEVGALEDRCCHRSAPLSVGRVRGDEIECGYHRLRFDREGNCTKIRLRNWFRRMPVLGLTCGN